MQLQPQEVVVGEGLLLLEELLLLVELVELLCDLAPINHSHLSLYVTPQNKRTNMLEGVQGLPLVKNINADGVFCV